MRAALGTFGSIVTSLIASLCLAADEPTPPDFSWWREARLGMFVHWGLYSEAGGVWEGRFLPGWSEWMLNRKKISPDLYNATLIPRFDPLEFDAAAWVRAAKDAGIGYIVITTKHHEGFAMWPSDVTDRDIAATNFGKPVAQGGRGRDALRELADACEKNGVRLGFYYSLLDWSHPDYLPRREWDKRPTTGADYKKYAEFMRAQVREILDGRYGKISILWGDGDWEHGAKEHTSDEIVAMARELQPGILINDRWSQPGDYATPENKIPEAGLSRPWETCMTLNGSWGFARDDFDFKSAREVLENLADIISKDGNYLLNIGPDGKGRIDERSLAVLSSIAQWMKSHASSVHNNGRAPLAAPNWGRWTLAKTPDGLTTFNAHIFKTPDSSRLRLPGVVDDPANIRVLGDEFPVPNFHRDGPDLVIDLPAASGDAIARSTAHCVVAIDFKRPPTVVGAPEITGDGRMFIGTHDIEFAPVAPGVTVHATLDGTEPTVATAAITPDTHGRLLLKLDDSATVRARCAWKGMMSHGETTAAFTREEPMPARECAAIANGLDTRVILGAFEAVPAASAFQSCTSSTVSTSVVLPPGVPADRYAVELRGLIRAPVEGIYRFELSSDDGSELFIDSKRIIDNGGLHGATGKLGDCALAAGCHLIEVRMFESVGGEALSLRWQLPGARDLAPIAPELLQRIPVATDPPVAPVR